MIEGGKREENRIVKCHLSVFLGIVHGVKRVTCVLP